MLDAAKMYYSGKVDREIAKYYFGDLVMQKMEIWTFPFFAYKPYLIIFLKNAENQPKIGKNKSVYANFGVKKV